MSKFRIPKKKGTEINTSALPDIIFLLLFFFMMSATIRPQTSPLDIVEPRAESLSKVERRELIKELQIGVSSDGNSREVLIHGNNQSLRLADIASWVIAERATLEERLQPQMIVLIRADEGVKMGLVADLQQELRKANARKVLYRAKVAADGE